MLKTNTSATDTLIRCAHCGDECPQDHIIYDDKDFCCNGCQMVYEVLKSNGLEDYYQYEVNPGVSQKSVLRKNYAFLDDEDVVSNLLEFKEETLAKISFMLPQIHCASCVWLLENINKLHAGILGSRVNFLAKTATISYNPQLISLRKVVELLSMIGYPPELNLQRLSSAKSGLQDRSIYYKLGLAGFAFGNIMLLSFPEYLGFEKASVKFYLGYINIVLALPVLLYSGIDYLRSAWWTIRLKQINIDIPIAVGMLTLFIRSVYEILTATGEGYLDSLVGFIFFLLIGKWFQQYTFYSISFDRNYKSYFPISALVKMENGWQSRSLDKLDAGDILLIKNEEIIPGDAILLKGNARIDYSFVTGESDLIRKESGDKLFAGGKNIGSNIQIQLIKKVSQSYLTKLWDEDTFRIDKESQTQTLIGVIGKYFTITIMSIAVLTLIYWLMHDQKLAYNAFTAVLIVACPCALALTVPFSYGNILRILGRKSFYLKNVQVIDRIQQVDEIIFDKTGTITNNKKMTATNIGRTLTSKEAFLIKSAVFQSNHPMSKAIFHHLEDIDYTTEVASFEEFTGKGTHTVVDGHEVVLGSAAYVSGDDQRQEQGVFVSIDGQYVTLFQIENTLRDGLIELVNTLGKKYGVTMLSGDNDKDKDRLEVIFPAPMRMIFHQKPIDKLNYVKQRQDKGHKVIMIGDGLNDAGALMQSDVGIVISEDANNFTPACDAILDARAFPKLLDYLTKLKQARKLIIGAFILAFIYNVAGLYFAVRGELSPIVAAILMPASSITVMVYGLLASTFLFRKDER
ncbi:MAG: heavy metal translocating P-type ATPase metal-binding domain-containing protein [Saprospiraceae bacterium]|nr:MAG: P-type HAD superfamily ATPase [Bacteroidetes bacterium OLB9]MCO6463520.1 heavy metal translocating P-type ATPase metal-binding domain-containing protein [Saprospiraceae bacterium]MCZ2339205.1 heavy metal translocating P-type ATPase metal-binding domain-containing protein [Chitinophagales bacterium]